MRILRLGMAGFAAVLMQGSLASPSAAQDLLVRRPNGTYQGVDAGSLGRRSGDSLYVSPSQAGNSRGIYDSQGRRVGTFETRPYGGGVVYDNQGRRR